MDLYLNVIPDKPEADGKNISLDELNCALKAYKQKIQEKKAFGYYKEFGSSTHLAFIVEDIDYTTHPAKVTVKFLSTPYGTLLASVADARLQKQETVDLTFIGTSSLREYKGQHMIVDLVIHGFQVVDHAGAMMEVPEPLELPGICIWAIKKKAAYKASILPPHEMTRIKLHLESFKCTTCNQAWSL